MLTSTNITAQSGKKYSDVLGKLDDFFEVIYERAQLNQRLQWEDKIVEQYTSLRYTDSWKTVSLVTQRTPYNL